MIIKSKEGRKREAIEKYGQAVEVIMGRFLGYIIVLEFVLLLGVWGYVVFELLLSAIEGAAAPC